MHKSKIGIYKIMNINNGDSYIGSSTQLNRRLNQHKRSLLNNKHINKHLQSAWNKYGEDNFKFEVIEELEHLSNLSKTTQFEYIFNREQYYIDNYNSKYNINRKAGFGYVENKIKKVNKIYQYSLNGDFIKEWDYFSDIEKYYNKSMNHIYLCLKDKRKIAYNYQWSYNKIKRKVTPLKKEVLLFDGDHLIKEYKSLAEAALDLNVSYPTVKNYCLGKYSTNKKFNNNFNLKFK